LVLRESSWQRGNRCRGTAPGPRKFPENRWGVGRGVPNPPTTASPCDLGAAKPSAVPRPRAESESACCRPGSEGNLRLEILRENVSSQNLIVPRWWGWGGGRTNVWVFDANGKQVTTSFLADELPPPPQPWDFVVLDGGQFVGTRMDEPATHFVNKPGVYELVVEYTTFNAAR